MQNRLVWTGFLLMCFLVTGLAGLFASYATPIPLERALMRSAVLDRVLVAAQAPDAAAQLSALRPALGESADSVLDGPGDLASRVAAARQVVLSEQDREERSIAYRSRLMVIVITFLAGGIGAAVVGLAARGAHG